MFACIDTVKHDGTEGGLPVLTGTDGFDAPVVVGDPYVQAKGRAATPGRLVKIPDGCGLVVVPAVAKKHADGIVSGSHSVGNIIGDVKIASVEAGVHGVEAMVPYLLP